MANTIVSDFLSYIPQDVYNEVSLNMDIANRIAQMLRVRKMSQRELAERMGKRESEISRWLTGTHGFNSNTLARIGAVMGEPVVFTEKTLTFNFSIPYSSAENIRLEDSRKEEPALGDFFSRCYLYNNQYGKE